MKKDQNLTFARFWWMQPLGSFHKGFASHLQFQSHLPTAPLSCMDPQPWAACSRAAPEHSMLLLQYPAASWGWGTHEDVRLQPPCLSVQVHLHRTVSIMHSYRYPSPAAQALPSYSVLFCHLQPSQELLWIRQVFVCKSSRLLLSQSTWCLLPSTLPHKLTFIHL